MSIKIYFVLASLLLSLNAERLCAQVFSEDLKAMHQFYQNQKSFKADVRVEIFEGMNDKAPILVKEAHISKNEFRFFYRVDDTEMLLTENELIMANNADKIVMYRKITRKEYEAAQNNFYLQQLDSVLTKYDSVHYAGTREGKKYYTIYSSNKLIQKTQLILDEKNNYIRQVIYDYHPKLSKNVEKIEVYFLNIDTHPVFAADLFLESRFVVKAGKNIQLSQKYSRYQLNIVDYED